MGETVNRYGGIVNRLTMMVAGILVIAALAAGSLAFLGQQRQLKRALGTKAATLAQLMAQVAPLDILSLNFVEMNNEVKKVVLTDEEAVYAVILNEKTVPLVYFFKDGDPLVTDEVRDFVRSRKPLAAIEAMKLTGRILEVTAPIAAGEKRIGSVILGFSYDKTRRVLLVQTALITAIMLLIISASIAMLRMALRRILHPVRELTAAAAEISGGNLNITLTGTDRSDELGILSRAFEGMAGRLRELIAGMEQRMAEIRRGEAALREGETRYRRIVDTAFEGICSLAPDSRITFINSRMAEMLGWSDAEMLDRPLTDFMFEADVPDHLNKMENRRQGLSESYERRFRRKKGDTVWTLVSATPVFNDQRRFQGSFGMFTDITERKRVEEKLWKLNQELEQRIRDRTAELEAKIAEIERMNRLFVGRELRMAELKEQISKLKGNKPVENT